LASESAVIRSLDYGRVVPLQRLADVAVVFVIGHHDRWLLEEFIIEPLSQELLVDGNVTPRADEVGKVRYAIVCDYGKKTRR
jgi:hypothetical protein